VYTRLTLLDLTDQERKELESLVSTSVHHTVLDTVLSKLSEKDKRAFLAHVSEEHNEKIWELLTEKVKNAESLIRKAVDGLKEKMHKDIEEVKQKNNTK
jgi:plasmid replication initiation protein